MRFLVDRCAGRRLARWLTETGHDVVDLSDAPADPGDANLLARSAEEGRILVTIDTDFGRLVFHHGAAHAGLIRLPDVPPKGRMTLMQRILDQHSDALERRAVVTGRGNRIRLARWRAGDGAEEAKANGRRFGTISYRWRNDKQFPQLRLSGDWLGEAGFVLGQQFEVTVSERRLTIDAV